VHRILFIAPALTICVSSTLAANQTLPVTHARGTAAHRVISALPGSVTLYDQNDSDAGVAIISTNFTDNGFDIYDTNGADDFLVPKGHKWKLREVDVTGIYTGNDGPAASENILVYQNQNGVPGPLFAHCDGIVGIDNQGGSFAIRLPRPCKVVLHGGRRYWISVVANMSFECCGTWTWETRNPQNGKPAAWENPNGGFDTPCTSWGVMTDCIGPDGEGPDFMFTLKGKDITN
jgi:hypothetical protein